MSQDLPPTFKVVTLWLLLGLGVFLGIQWWLHAQQQTRFRSDGGMIEIARGPDGHYHWPGRINGREVDFLIDTGATSTAISAALAQELQLDALGRVQSNTAAGVVSGQVVSGNVTLDGGVVAERLRITALPGLGERPLLGMDVLGRLRWTQEAGVLRIDLRPR
ncbi:MAG: retroviral-like aspartic protease family protein [Rhizobacter sp.]|jgi:aspartyl protease family protein|nr:retroviral-like aspartic protease family protein [Rhizobacter sp.]MBP6270557.1 retroviral-like aspartic protease family protein [Rhizobacter sp.]